MAIVAGESQAKCLSDPEAEVAEKIAAARELKEELDSSLLASTGSRKFAPTLLPAIMDVLRRGSPVFDSAIPEQKLRYLLLEILHRIPHAEASKAQAQDVTKLMIALLREENEENAALCVKVIVDMFRTFTTILEEQVPEFLAVVCEFYTGIDDAVKKLSERLDNVGEPEMDTPVVESPAPHVGEVRANRILGRGSHSFKVLTECPIVVVMLFNTYTNLVPTCLPPFPPLILDVLKAQVRQQAEAHAEAEARGEYQLGLTESVKDRVAYTQFIVFQVKTVSFLAHAMKNNADLVRPYQEGIPRLVVRILQDIPSEASSVRKELLVATRHILSTEFRTTFISVIDLLLDQRVIIGTGLTTFETLSPLGYSMLADLVHHVRSELSPEQLTRTVLCYAKHLHEPTLASNLQTMCVKLLLNLVDTIIHIQDRTLARSLLATTLETFSNKFVTLNENISTVMAQRKRAMSSPPVTDLKALPLDKMEHSDFDLILPIQTNLPVENHVDRSRADGRFLLKNLVMGLKTVVFGLRHCVNALDSAAPPGLPKGFTAEEITITIRLFREGVKTFDYFLLEVQGPGGAAPVAEKLLAAALKEEKDSLEYFGSLFLHLGSAAFHEVMTSQMDFFIDKVFVNHGLIGLAQFFLANEGVSQIFTSIMLKFLVERLPQLGSDGPEKAMVTHRLYKLVFMAVTLFPEQNEVVLLPHLSTMIMGCLTMSSKAKEPMNYFNVLKALFRSIGGGRFELLYKEVLPMLPVILEGLNERLVRATRPHMREVFVELCLTVPVRLSVLLPHLGYLMKPLVNALQPGTDLVAQGLRTLELCIDNLTQEFLDPLMAPVIHNLMSSLQYHLDPRSDNEAFAFASIRILGKLGGRNRRLLKEPSPLPYKDIADTGIEVSVGFHGLAGLHSLQLDKAVAVATAVLARPDCDKVHKEHAVRFLRDCLNAVLDLEKGDERLGEWFWDRVEWVQGGGNTDARPPGNADDMDIEDGPGRQRSQSNTVAAPRRPQRVDKKMMEEHAFRDVCLGLFRAAALPELKGGAGDEAWRCLRHVIRHFAFLKTAELLELKEARGSVLVDRFGKYSYVNTELVVDIIVDVATAEDLASHEFGGKAMVLFHKTCVEVIRSAEQVSRFPVFQYLATRLSSSCYKHEWYRKVGAGHGIKVLVTEVDLGKRWMQERQAELVRALLYLLKDSTLELSTEALKEARNTISHIINLANRPEEGGRTAPSAGEVAQPRFGSLVMLLVSELSSPHGPVREAVQSTLQLLCDLTGIEVTDMLNPLRLRLLTPIFTKPLRALPFPIQIGHIDAIRFCLALRPPFLEFNDELQRLLQESLALADAEDQALTSCVNQLKHADALVQLRIVCIRLLSTAMVCPEFQGPRNAAGRSRIISVFFKSLYSKSTEVIDAAYTALKAILHHQHKLAKDLLQAALRPVLVSLADHKRVSLSALDGLGRLLDLLPNFFKVEIGRKLLDHLRHWGEPSNARESGGVLVEMQEHRVLSAMLRLFHLLPHGAVGFLEEIFTIGVNLEAQLRRPVANPLRPSLMLYANRYPAESIVFFHRFLEDDRYSRMFVAMLDMQEAGPLRSELIKNAEGMLASALLGDGGVNENMMTDAVNVSIERQLQTLKIMSVLTRHDAAWIGDNKAIADALRRFWRSPERRARIAANDIAAVKWWRETVYLVDVILGHLNSRPDEIDFLLDLVEVFAYKTFSQFLAPKKYFQTEMAVNWPPYRKKAVMTKFFALLADKEVETVVKIQGFRKIAMPILYVSLKSEPPHFDQIFDNEMLEQARGILWPPKPSFAPDSARHIEDQLRMEYIQFSSLILDHAPQALQQFQKEMLKFAWGMITLGDVTPRQSAYVFLARFIAAYDSSDCPKIAMPVFLSLLRASQVEAKTFVRQALDILGPVLPQRLPPVDPAAQLSPTWAVWTKKILTEDTSNVAQFNCYQFVVRHHDLYYVCRDQFVPHLIATIPRLGLQSAFVPEARVAAIELAEVISKWEKRRISAKEQPVPMDIDNPTENVDTKLQVTLTVPPEAHNFELTAAQKETYIAFLIRSICMSNESPAKKGLVSRAMGLLRVTLELWPSVTVKLNFFERFLVQHDFSENTMHAWCNGLDALKMVLERKTYEWFRLNVSAVNALLEKSLKSNNVYVARHLAPVVSIIFKTLPEGVEASELSSFVEAVNNVIKDGFSLHTASGTNFTKPSGPFSFLLLQATCDANPNQLDGQMESLVRYLPRITKEHIQNPKVAEVANMINLALQLIKPRVPFLGTHRLQYLQVLIQLLEKTSDLEICRSIMRMVGEWIQNRADPTPTMKEKANLMVQMLNFEKREDSALLDEYLKLVLSVYEDPTLARTELTVRLEPAFLMGCRNSNHVIRSQFLALFNRSLGYSMFVRLHYVVALQNWESLASQFWLPIALDLLLGSIDGTQPVTPTQNFHFMTIPLSTIGHGGSYPTATNENLELIADIKEHQLFLQKQASLRLSELVGSLRYLIHLDSSLSYELWMDIFSSAWSRLKGKERSEITKGLIPLLAKDFHKKQAASRPNVIQALLEGISRCSPLICLPPQLLKYLGKTFCAWHISVDLLERTLTEAAVAELTSPKDEELLKDCTLDALAQLYSTLAEDDMFYGVWRRRCQFPETNAALSYEQHGCWDKAQALYESVQQKARTESLPLNESEYCLWEDHWIICTQKLQQWDLLTDLAKHDGNTDLTLECAWRLSDWNAEYELLEQTLKSVADVPTPRRKIFEVFMVLSRIMDQHEDTAPFERACEQGMRVALQHWASLPEILAYAHVELLHQFQLFVEMQEAASNVYQILNQTTAENLEVKTPDLKSTLQTWRERLPNLWDDLNCWSDIVAWRQHIFTAINKVYLPLVPSDGTATNPQGNHTYAFRGYHETAWIINRFAHVSRKHKLIDVCISSLAKIYTLPNIEVQDAFLKLCEQAKCHLHNEAELAIGLEVINNTNLVFFGSEQKAEFYTLKGRFLSRLGLQEEANRAFSSALRIDLNVGKAWAAWGYYNDRLFKDNPDDFSWAASAVDCYLQAAAIYKNLKARQFLLRILWLLSQDGAQGAVLRSFEAYKGETPTWYWIPFIPQLLTSLTQREAPAARFLLIKIARSYPQALYYLLRTQREEYSLLRRAGMLALVGIPSGGNLPQRLNAAVPSAEPPMKTDTASADGAPIKRELSETPGAGSQVGSLLPSSSSPPRPPAAQPSPVQGNASTLNPATSPAAPSPLIRADGTSPSQTGGHPSPLVGASPRMLTGTVLGSRQPPQTASRQPWDAVDEIFGVMKTAFPLLAASMETMVEQMSQRLKPNNEEDIYRLLSVLLNDAAQQAFTRLMSPNDNGMLNPTTEANLMRLADSLFAGFVKTSFENDFIKVKLTIAQYIARLREWRDRFELMLDNRTPSQPLEMFSHYLSEFEHQRFDDVEVPGQYLDTTKDSNSDFIRIDRFMPDVDLVRSFGFCHKRMTIRGHDGSFHRFYVQHPTARQSRREEKLMQLHRILNNILNKKIESRKRGLYFHLPVIVPLAPAVRIVQDDPSNKSLAEIYENHCDRTGAYKDQPIIYYQERFAIGIQNLRQASARNINQKQELLQLRQDLFEDIAARMIPETILHNYMARTMNSVAAFWNVRKKFTSQMAAVTFMTYFLGAGNRFPHRFILSRNTGNVWTTDLLPMLNAQGQPSRNEAVPFRLTPTLQHFMTPIGIEGVFANSIMVIARTLTECENLRLEDYLSLFIRDEFISVSAMAQMGGNKPMPELPIKERTQQFVNQIVKRAKVLASLKETESSAANTIPANQAVLDLISDATAPVKLALMDPIWYPQL